MIELIRIYFLSIKRNSLFETKLIITILTFIGFIYLVLNLIVVGLFLDKILIQIEPESDPIDTFSRFFLFLLIIDILLKFFFKSYKYINTIPYLTLPVTRKKIYTLLFIKELLSKWNYIWVILLTPFFFKTVYPAAGLASTFLLILTVYFVSLTISLIIRFVDVLSTWKSSLYAFLPLLLAICVGYIGYYITVSSKLLIDIHFLFSQYKTIISIILILSFICLFIIFQRFCRRELYAQLIGKKKNAFSFDFSWFNNFGINGEIIKLCLKEIVRSQLKRIVLAYILALISGFILFSADVNFFSRCFVVFLPILVLFGNTFGEYTFNAESTFFDKLMVSPKNIPYLILKIKYAFCVFLAAFMAFIYIIFVNKIPLLFWISSFSFGCGLLFFNFQTIVYNKQRFDIITPVRKLSNFTIQSLLSMFFIFLSIGIVVVAIKGLTSETTTEWVMLISGIISISTSPVWLKNIYNRFMVRRHNNMNGFRGN